MLAFNNLIWLPETGKLTSAVSATQRKLNSCTPLLEVYIINAKAQLKMILNTLVISWTPFFLVPLMRQIWTVSYWNVLPRPLFATWSSLAVQNTAMAVSPSYLDLNLCLIFARFQVCVRGSSGWAVMPLVPLAIADVPWSASSLMALSWPVVWCCCRSAPALAEPGGINGGAPRASPHRCKERVWHQGGPSPVACVPISSVPASSNLEKQRGLLSGRGLPRNHLTL